MRVPRRRCQSIAIYLFLASAGVACRAGEATTAPSTAYPPALESIPWDAVGTGKVVFERTGPTTTGGSPSGTYILDGRARASTALSFLGSGVAISPDGLRLAFRYLTSFDTFWDIYVSELDGRNRRQVSAGPDNEVSPNWSPDGTRLMFQVNKGFPASTGIYSVAANATRSLGQAVRSVSGVGGGRFSQSPTGAVVFAGLFSGPSGPTAGIAQMQSDGSGLTILRSVAASSPAWSPDAQRIAYLEQVPGSVSVSVMNADGAMVVKLGVVPNVGTESWAFQDNPLSLCWTSDGLGILFTAPEGNFVSHVFAVAAAGGDIRRVTSAEGVSDISVSCSR